jgi:Flp pilus assembly protein TadD
MITELRRGLVLLVLCASSGAAFAQVDAFQKNIPAADVKVMQDARALRLKGRYDPAIKVLQELVVRQPDYFNAHYELGLALSSRAESTADGLPELEKAAALKRAHPEINDAHVFNSLGWAYMFSYKPKQAEAAFKEAEKNVDQLSPDARKRLFNNMGYFYLTRGKLKDSEKYLNLAATKYDSAPATKNLRTLEYMKKQESETK